MMDDDAGATMRWRTTASVLVATCLGSMSCVLVQPPERKHLSTPEMIPATDALEDTFHAHINAARHGATNGHGGGGGGCGCG